MVFPFTLNARRGRITRIIAVLALLCLTGAQALEASHDHGFGHSQAECLLCKTSAPLPLASALPFLLSPLLVVLLLPAPRRARAHNRYLPRLTTGPPAHS